MRPNGENGALSILQVFIEKEPAKQDLFICHLTNSQVRNLRAQQESPVHRAVRLWRQLCRSTCMAFTFAVAKSLTLCMFLEAERKWEAWSRDQPTCPNRLCLTAASSLQAQKFCLFDGALLRRTSCLTPYCNATLQIKNLAVEAWSLKCTACRRVLGRTPRPRPRQSGEHRY